MTRRRRRPEVQIDDNEWITVAWSDQREQCCDCGAEHTVDHRVVDGEFQLRGKRLKDGTMLVLARQLAAYAKL